MIEQSARDCGDGQEARLPRRDWILLPMLSVLTICLIAASGELIARQVSTPTKSNINSCLSNGSSSRSIRGIPNSVCLEEGSETGRVDYRMNADGYRGEVEIGPKPPGSYRIVMTGSSFVFGEHVPLRKTIAELLPAELSQLTGKKVELYNEGMMGGFPGSIALRFNDLVAARPDMILWIVTAYDIEHSSQFSFEPAVAEKKGLASRALQTVKSCRIGTLLEQYVYNSPNNPVKLHLMGAGSPGFLRAVISPELRHHLLEFEGYFADVEGRAKALGIPIVVVMVPGRSQAAMISMETLPAGYNPYKLGEEVRDIVVRHGGIYVDILPDFRDVSNPERLWFPIANHPNVDGHAIISRMLAKELTTGSIPALKADMSMQIALEKRR
jgi:hypothetical protein